MAVGNRTSRNPETEINELVPRLREAAGRSLVSLVVYGSAAGQDFRRNYSDINILIVVDKLGLATLRALAPTLAWWRERGHPGPVLFTRDEIQRSADVFSIELYDMKQRHRVLSGEDVLAKLEIPMNLHRVQLERELRVNLLRLRQAYLADPADDSVLQLMLQSLSSFGTLFRHVLIALGEEPPAHRRDVILKLGGIVAFETKPFLEVYEVREGRAHSLHVDETFRQYLNAIEQVTNWVDRTLDHS